MDMIAYLRKSTGSFVSHTFDHFESMHIGMVRASW